MSKTSAAYKVIRQLPNTSAAHIMVSRLRAEDIDVRIRNNNSSSIYPLMGIGMEIEVLYDHFETAEKLIEQMEADALHPNPDIDFREADHGDIQFEKEINEHDQKMSRTKPLNLIYLLIFIILAILLSWFSFQFHTELNAQ